jgi:hypothetical protein
MFLHLGRFTKQVKDAYKSYHLDIGNINDGMLISTGYWMVWIKNQYVSNEIKAVVMLLAGTLPKPDEMFTVEKHRPDPQCKIIDDCFYRCISRDDLYMKLVVTPVLLTENYDIRMIQGLDRQIYGINQDYLDIIDKEAIDFDAGEGTPTGPCFTGDINQGIYWYNDFGIVMILPIATKKNEIPAVLSLLKFGEDGSIDKKYFEGAVREVFRDFKNEFANEKDTDNEEGSEPGADIEEEADPEG